MKLPYQNPVAVSAHRGNSADHFQNTMGAFRSAIEIGCDMIETDIHMSSDGELFLIHDHRLDELTNGTGLVRENTSEEIFALRTGDGARVPTLRQLLELFSKHPQMLLNLELKDFVEESGDHAWESAKRTLAMLEEYDMFDRTVVNTVSGGNGEINAWIHETYGNRVRLHAYWEMFTEQGHSTSLYPSSYCSFVYGRTAVLRIPQIKQMGLEAWTCYKYNSCQMVFDSIAAGANVILADDPGAVIAMLREKGLHR